MLKIKQIIIAILLGITFVSSNEVTVLAETGGDASKNIEGVSEDSIIASGECGDNVTWELDVEGVLTISGSGIMADYAYTNFKPTTPWYDYERSIKKIIVEDGIESVGDSAFSELSYVTSVQLSDDILSLKSRAFFGCYNLKEIDLPDSLQYIGSECFVSCHALSSIDIPDSVTKIGSYAFYACRDLASVKLPANVTTLPMFLFWDCESLESLTIPNTVTEIGSSCFEGCTSLKEIDIPQSTKSIGSEAFDNCTSLVNISLPNNLQTISSKLFYGCTALKKIEIPDAITTIESKAFYNCLNLDTIALPVGLVSIEDQVFFNCTKLSDLFIPEGVTTIGTKAYGFYENIYDETEVVPEAKIYSYIDSLGTTYAQKNGVPYSIVDVEISRDECIYTGNPVMPNVKITIDDQLLEKDIDFTVDYVNNIDVGMATAKITFINEYASIGNSLKKSYQIGIKLSECEITLDQDEYYYQDVIPKVVIKLGDDSLVYGRDYEVYYTLAGETWKKPKDNVIRYLWDLGDCTVKIVGLNQYIGEKEITVTVDKFNMSKAELMTEMIEGSSWTFTLKTLEYDGNAKEQSGYRVCDDNFRTISSDYYEVSYLNNIESGIATMVITGKGDYYTGTLEKLFWIVKKNISGANVVLEYTNTIYTGTARIPTVTVKDGERVLVKDKDYTVEYSNNTDAGTATVTITGEGNYTGTITKTFDIVVCSHNWSVATCTTPKTCKTCGAISGSTVGHSYGNWIVTKKATCTAAGSRYKVCSCGNKVTETIKVAGHNYKVIKVDKKATTKKNGKITKQCTACKVKVSETTYRAKSISLSKTKFTYNGKTQKPTVVVKDSKGRAISSSNYKVSFSKGCKNAGTYKVTVTLKGQYSGKLTKTFKISKAKPKITASNFTKVKGDKAFSINAKVAPKGGKVTYKTSNKKIVTVSSKGKVTIKGKGKATITITSASNKNCSKVTKKITVTVK